MVDSVLKLYLLESHLLKKNVSTDGRRRNRTIWNNRQGEELRLQ